jgi:hypothetical protein
MNGPPDLPIDSIPLPIPNVPDPVTPPADPAAEVGPAVGAPAPKPRWVGEAVRDLLRVSRKKLVVLSVAGSVVAVGLALNALFTGIGLTPPATPGPEQPAEPTSLAAAQTEPPAPESKQSETATTPPETKTVEPLPVVGMQPPDLRRLEPSAPLATGGVPAPAIPDVPSPAPPVAGDSGTFVEPAPIITAAHTEPTPAAPTTPVPKQPAEVKVPPAPALPPVPTIEPTPATPAPKTTEIKPPELKSLMVVPPATPATGDATQPTVMPDLKGVPPVTLAPEEKKDEVPTLPPPVPRPAEGSAPLIFPAGVGDNGAGQVPAPTQTIPTAPGLATASDDLPARVITPAVGGKPPEPKDAIPIPPSPFKAVPDTADNSVKMTKPPLGARPASDLAPPKTDFDVDLHQPKAGDTYESISKLHYRDARYAEALRQFNRSVELDRGIDVRVPPMYVLRQRFSQLIAPARSSPNTPEWAPPAGRERK